VLVEIGHDGSGQGPAVTYARIPELYTNELDGVTPERVALHLARANGPVTHLPGLEAALSIIHPWGVLSAHGVSAPRWVRSDDEALAQFLAGYYEVPAEAPPGVEDTHWTKHGAASYPPGAIPDPMGSIEALLTQAGRDIFAASMFSALGTATVLGLTGTAGSGGSAPTATTLTGGSESGTPNHASNDAAGQIIVTWGTGVYGYVTGNTTGTSPVYTVDRWYTPLTPGGAAATTPAGGVGYTLLSGGPPNLFMGLSATAVAPALGDTTLPGEITTASGGLVRKIAVMAHTAGVNTVSATASYTVNGSDIVPVVLFKMALGPSMVATVKNALQTALSATATLNAIGDQITVTDTITTS
jgi:hypothetical protein